MYRERTVPAGAVSKGRVNVSELRERCRMIEVTIYGRGGQGGVTLAKLIATAHFQKGKHVQAFGVYAAERSGAPLQAYVRVDDEEITNHNQIQEPDHVIVLDRTLIAPRVVSGLKSDGWLILNTPEEPKAFAKQFSGRNVATVDATGIALSNGLGTRTVPIVNTTMLGAVAQIFDLSLADVEAALESVKFGGPNITSARQAFDAVRMKSLRGSISQDQQPAASEPVAGLLDDSVGGMPRIQTGSWATRQPQRQDLTPPCNAGCPAGNNVRGFVEAVGQEAYDRALGILLETTPFPGICGRVCPAPCMDACNRQEYDEAVNVRELERYVADHARWPDPTKPSRKEKVAIIGSGPAGLSAAYQLGRLGYRTTLFEAGREIGGLLRTGIPAYRLPRDVLAKEIDHILQHGVEVHTGCRVTRKGLTRLTHEYAAVFIATGLQESRALNLGSEASGRVIQGIDFLDRVCVGDMRVNGEHVIVIGGGNTAVDAARSARRVGAKSVRIVYRRTRAEMPAIHEEIDEALEEGIALDELVSPLTLQKDGAGTVLTCQRMKLGEPDDSGRPRPVPDESEGAQFDLRCDRVILALGQSSDLSILPEGSEIREDNALLGLTGAPIFTGGDFATNDGTVTAAIGSGRKAALHIHRTLTGEDLFPPEPEPVAQPDVLHMHIFEHTPREHGDMIAPRDRRHTFTEVRLGFRDEPSHRPAVAEANRCFSCGVCNSCDRCLEYCPEGIVLRNGEGYRFDYSYCKGCGICATQCPRGVIFMSEL